MSRNKVVAVVVVVVIVVVVVVVKVIQFGSELTRVRINAFFRNILLVESRLFFGIQLEYVTCT